MYHAMNKQRKSNYQQANYQYLWASVEQIRQILEAYIAPEENQRYLTESETQFDPENSNLHQLCTLFHLSFFERNILLLCLGMELDPYFSLLCAEAQRNPELNYPTLGLAVSALPGGNWNVLSAQNPLQYWGLIEIGTGLTLTQSPICLDRRILCYLLGEPSADEKLAAIIKPLAPSSSLALPPSHQSLVSQIVAIWSEITFNSTCPVVQLCGSEVTAKRAIASAACTLLRFNLNVISSVILLRHANELNHLLIKCEREALLSHSALLLDWDHSDSTDCLQEFAISHFIEELNTPLIISSLTRYCHRDRPIVSFDVPQLSYSEQQTIWLSHLNGVTSQLNGNVEQLVSQFNLSPSAIQAACTQFISHKAKLTTEAENQPEQEQLWHICCIQARPRLEALAQRIESHADWQDLIIPEEQRQTLEEITAHLRQKAKVYQLWGFAHKSPRGLGITALFAGQSGTGKTMAAEVLARELHLDLYRIDLSAVVSKYIGETEKNLRRIFDAAETGGAILLFDEADALFGKRTQVKDSHDRHANVEVSYLLQRMEAYQGLAILTTNLKDALDSAFLRRIRFLVSFPFPDEAARTEIWRRIFPSQTPTEGLNFNKLGHLSVAGGNIRNIALNAAVLAADADEPVMMKHILRATKSEYLKLERTLTDSEIRGWIAKV
jgi:AAA+ superfamily predicted ATPase